MPGDVAVVSGGSGARRRSPAVVSELILQAAERLFAQHGYRGTSLRDIAVEAGVAESQIIRKFGSKSELFTQAVREPFARYIDEFYATWQSRDGEPISGEELTRRFVEGVFDLFAEHRRLLVALVSSNAFVHEVRDLGLGPALRKMEAIQAIEVERGGLHSISPLSIRTLVAMVMSIVICGDFVYAPDEPRPSRDELVEEIIAITVHGLDRH